MRGFGPNSSCSSLQQPIPATLATVTDTHASEPAVPGTTKRVSIVTSATGGGMYWIQVQNTSTTVSHYVSVGVTETTIYSATWTTYGGYITQFVLQNTTSQSIAYTLTLTGLSNPQGPVTYSISNTLGPLPGISSNAIIGTSTAYTLTFRLCHSHAQWPSRQRAGVRE